MNGFWEKWEKPILVNLGPFWAHLGPNGPNRNFFQKSGIVTFFPLLNYIIMQTRRQTLMDPRKKLEIFYEIVK